MRNCDTERRQEDWKCQLTTFIFYDYYRPIRTSRTNHRPSTRQPIPCRPTRRPGQRPHAIRPRAGIREILQQLFAVPARRSVRTHVQHERRQEAEVYESVYWDYEGEGGEAAEGAAGCREG